MLPYKEGTGLLEMYGIWQPLKEPSYQIQAKSRRPQIALSTRLSSRHIVPKFENTLKMAFTFKKKTIKGRILAGTKSICGSLKFILKKLSI